MTMMTKTPVEAGRKYYLYGDKLIINSIFWGGRKWPFVDYGGTIRSHTLPIYNIAYHGQNAMCSDFEKGIDIGIWEIDRYKAYFFSEKRLIEAFCKTIYSYR